MDAFSHRRQRSVGAEPVRQPFLEVTHCKFVKKGKEDAKLSTEMPTTVEWPLMSVICSNVGLLGGRGVVEATILFSHLCCVWFTLRAIAQV